MRLGQVRFTFVHGLSAWPATAPAIGLAIALFAAAPATAAKLVPLEPTFNTAPAPAIRARFQDAVGKGASSAYEVISPSETRTRIEAQHLGACKDAECFGKVATSFGADGVVAVQVEETGKRYGVQVHLYDAAGREVGKVVTEFCDICTVREATETVEKAVRQALSKASFVPPPPPAPIKPPPSTVTPPDDAEEGPNALRSSAAEKRVIDEARQQRPPRTPGSSENEVPPRVTLGESRDAPPAPRREIVEPADKGDGHFPYRPLAGAAFGVAGVALIVTVVFSVYHLKYDNQPTCTLADPKRNCPEVYSGNTAPAAVMGVLTVLSAGTGALLLYLDSRSRHHATAMLVPTPDGFAASASFQF